MNFFGCVLLGLISLINASFAGPANKNLQGKWAYYGEQFYNRFFENSSINKDEIHSILNSTHISNEGDFDELSSTNSYSEKSYRQRSVSYVEARKIMFGELDKKEDDNGTYVVDVYCGKKFYYTNLDQVSGMHRRVNIEHTWPQSKFSSRFSRSVQKTDMHHLFLTDSYANSARGSDPFGDSHYGPEGCDDSPHGFTYGSSVYTPPSKHQGNVARALFYFSTHYNLPIRQKEEETLRRWHKLDPVDQAERKRHEGIVKHQNIRNPYIDHPELVDKIIDF